jgi:NADH dehydrogenase
VDDLATLCVDLGAREETVTVDAVGPESLAFRQLVETIRTAVGSRSVVVPVPGALIPMFAGALSVMLRDRLLTPDEYRSMAAGLADSTAPATGSVAVTQWIREHSAELGRHYASELDRHFR